MDKTYSVKIAPAEPHPVVFINVDTSLYPKEAVLRLAYWLHEDAQVDLKQASPSLIEMTLVPRFLETNVDDLKAKVQQGLVDFTLRLSLEEKTQNIRNQIWAYAFGELRS
jgi:His-Xaa-Ser system protein HxsD